MLPLARSVRESGKSHVNFLLFPRFRFFLLLFLLFSFFFFFHPSRFSLCPSRGNLQPSVRHRGNWFFLLHGDELARKHADTSQPSRSGLFSKQDSRLYSRGMQVRRLIAKEEQFVDPTPALNCFGFSLNRSRVMLHDFATPSPPLHTAGIIRLKKNHARYSSSFGRDYFVRLFNLPLGRVKNYRCNFL